MDRSYRRGAIMGLTMAEAFILIAFSLLLLFAFWQWERNQEETPEIQAFRNLSYVERQILLAASQDKSIDTFMALRERDVDFKLLASIEQSQDKWRFIDKDELRRLLDTASEFPPDMQRDLADMIESEEIQKILKEMTPLEELVKSGQGIADLIDSAEVIQAIEDAGMSPQDLLARERWRFIDKDELRRLLDAASEFPPDMQRDLADMVESEEARKILKEMASLEELVASGQEIADLIASTEAAQAIEDTGMSPQDLLATVNILKDLENSDRTLEELMEASEKLSKIQQAGQTLEDISRHISQAEAQQEMMVGALKDELGDIVSEIGGRIDDDGAIILPDTVLFDQGSTRITPVLRNFLEDACEPWVTTLKSSGIDIAEIKIEGHASSEWHRDSSPKQAYLGNLDISQRRSQAVLRVCLDVIEDSDVIDWAREHMIAVGYSSVRPVIKDGQEDRAASRRVVLSATPNREVLIDQIETEAKSAAEGQ